MALPLTDDELSRLHIATLVLHQVGPTPADLRIFAGRRSPGRLETFFLGRLADANKGSRYEFRPESRVLVALRAIRDNDAMLTAHGEALARDFQAEHMHWSGRGAFVLFTLSLDDERLFAIVKFDHESVVNMRDDEAEVDLELLEKAIVEDKKAMQKSAIIRLTPNGGDLVLLDRSTTVPEYFERFLGVQRERDPKILSKELAHALNATAEDRVDVLGEPFVERMPYRIFDAFQALDAYDPEADTLITTVFTHHAQNPLVRETFEAKMRAANLSSEHFTIDKTVQPRPARTRYVLQEGTEIIVPDEYSDHVDISRLREGIIVIRTTGIRNRELLTEKGRRIR